MGVFFEVSHLTVGYQHPVVSDVSFSVQAGELVGILGRNGQGKSTLLRGIIGDARRFSGEVRVNGVDCTHLSAKKRAALLSALPQKTEIPAGVSAEEILEMGCYPTRRLFQGLTEVNRTKIREEAERMGLTELLEQDCSKLSIGQQQMVLLCRMLVQDAPVMLLDEPNASLDYANAQTLFSTLRELVHRKNKAGVLVLHDPETALRWCDRLLILHDGALYRDIDLAQCSVEQMEQTLRRLYPNICVRENPYHEGYFCYLQAQKTPIPYAE